GSLMTVEKDRVFAAVEDFQELAQRDVRRQPGGREAEVFLRNIVAECDATLIEIPGFRIAAAAQVDDRAYMLLADELFQSGGGQLRGAIDFARDDRVKIATEQNVKSVQGQRQRCSAEAAPSERARQRAPGGWSDWVNRHVCRGLPVRPGSVPGE